MDDMDMDDSGGGCTNALSAPSNGSTDDAMDNVDMDNLGGGNTNDLGSCSSLATFKNHTTSSDTSASFVSLFLTNRVSLLSNSDKSTGNVTDNVDMDNFGGVNTNGPGVRSLLDLLLA